MREFLIRPPNVQRGFDTRNKNELKDFDTLSRQSFFEPFMIVEQKWSESNKKMDQKIERPHSLTV